MTILSKPYTLNPDDDFLTVHLRKLKENHFVTHIHNSQSGGYSSGHYFDNLDDALADYHARGVAKNVEKTLKN
jgi:hypothetical protein